MTRNKGSVNKMIHSKTRNYLDIQKICDTDSMLNGTHPPRHWLLRLIEISGNLPYIISTKDLGVTAKQFILSDYITPELELKADAPRNLIFQKPGPRNNHDIFQDIDEFVQNIFNYYLNRWNEEDQYDYIKIRNEVSNLRMITQRGLNNCRKFQYHRLFLLNDGKSDNFQPIQPDISFNSTADVDIMHQWQLSWLDFWLHMSKSINELVHQFSEPKFYYKLKNGKKKSDFNGWLEHGLMNFLEPTNRKVAGEDMNINHLKYLILSKSDVKK
jgi:hypothetical protein